MHLHPAPQLQANLQQQQLASLLAAALPTSSDDSSLETSDDASRVAALSSLHLAILYPHNILLLHHSSAFMCQALLQLLSDKSLAVRQAAAVTVGALGSLGSSHSSINGHLNLSLTGGPADMFLGWALAQLSNYTSDETAILSLSGLHEFVNVGETTAIEFYVPSIIRTCQAVLENEGTSMNLLCPLLDIVRKIATRFSEVFQLHFVDLVDLLLGWALLPDISESDYSLITESFLQFQKFWARNLSFSLSLLSKLLGDIEVFALDGSSAALDQLHRRLLPLASCFVAILQAMASGVLEIGLAHEICEPLRDLLPRLLTCLNTIGQKCKTYDWMRQIFNCLTCFANLLKDRFSEYYVSTIDLLFQTASQENLSELVHRGSIIQFSPGAYSSFLSSNQIHMLLKVNLQLIDLQGSSILPFSVRKLLQPGSFFSCLRLHPSRKVTGMVSATYLLLLQHNSIQLRDEVVNCLTEELGHLKLFLFEKCTKEKLTTIPVLIESDRMTAHKSQLSLSEREFAVLIKFDLSLLTSSICISLDMEDASPLCASLKKPCKLCKAMELKEKILQKLSPFEDPVQCYPEIQLAVIQSLRRICCINTEKGHNADCEASCPSKIEQNLEVESLLKRKRSIEAIMEGLCTCSSIIAKSLHTCSSFPVKLEGLEWLGELCKMIIDTCGISSQVPGNFFCLKDTESYNPVIEHACISKDVLSSLLQAASDKEQKVRSHVALVLGMLFQAELIDTSHYVAVASIALEQVGDSEPAIRSIFESLLATVAPAALWISGLSCSTLDWRSQLLENSVTHGRRYMHWMRVFGIREFTSCIRSQHLVCILNFLSQRTQMLPLNWLHRLVQNFPGNLKSVPSKIDSKCLSPLQDPINSDIDTNMLERVCTTNNLVSSWWAIHEAARHCITVRLRTHLGGPTQTFAALERMLLDIVHSLQNDSGQVDAGTGASTSYIRLLPMRLLLEFVEALKKNIYNAYEGSVVLSAPPTPSIHFFRANRKVCEEWFTRIGEALMNASLALQCYAGTSQHAQSHLQYLRGITSSLLRETAWNQGSDSLSLKMKAQQDVLKTLRCASYALCRMHDESSILGLQVWALSTFGSLLAEDGKTNALGGPLGWMKGLALQAGGQYEKAAAHFSHLLQSEEDLSVLGSDEIQFIISRTIDSFVALADWDSLDCWLQELHALRTRHAGKAYAGALTTAGIDMNAIHALARFDNGDLQGAWGFLDLTPQNNSDLTADPHQALQRSEQMLLQALLRRDNVKDEIVAKEIETAKAMLDEALLVSGIDKLSDAASYVVQLHCIKLFEAKWYSVLEKDDVRSSSPSSSSFESLQNVVSVPLDALNQDCLPWLKLLRVYKAVSLNSCITLQLQQQLVRLARKQENFLLAHRMLNSAILSKLPSKVSEDTKEGTFTEIEYERILLLYAEEQHELALRTLWNVVIDLMSSLHFLASCGTKSYLKAKACLKLSSWLRKEQLSSRLIDSFSVMKLGSKVDDTDGSNSAVDRNNVAEFTGWPLTTNLEELIGTIVKSATLLCPDMAKAWFSYAYWCYEHAKAFLSGNFVFKKQSPSPRLIEEEINASSSLNEKEVEDIYRIISQMIASVNLMQDNKENPKDDIEMMKKDNARFCDAVAQHIIYLMHVAAGAVGDGGSPVIPLSLRLQQELYALLPSAGTSYIATFVNSLMGIWWAFRKRRVTLYRCAVQGFMKYLSFSSWTSREKISHEGYAFCAGVNRGREDFLLRSSLYVLHILLNYGTELEDVIKNGLLSVSPRPWQEVTVQLFARLSSHPEPIVRKQMEGLLVTLANFSPWSVVYPTFVDLNACESKPSEELQRILGCLVNRHPKLVNDVKLLVMELGAITVLWEEQWLSTLQDLHTDVNRRIATLKEEATRVAENTTLSHMEKSRINVAKYSAMMAPIVVALERRLATTSRQPESPHEVWFHEQYACQLKNAISCFKSPPKNIASIGDVWRPFDAIATSLANHQKRSLVRLNVVAPRLASLVSSDIPIPGLEKQFSATVTNLENGSGEKLPEIVTVAGFDNQVFILATKTKPKKLSMLGSDSQRYTYLLKGREDLRLDARIMQLLRAVNGMLKSRRSTRNRDLSARYYSVTPISGQAGLIQWVDNLTSMYGVYKGWQQRNQAAQTVAGVSTSKTNMSVAPSLPRPSDMFYGKIIPALKEKGLRKVISRKDWPQEVKRKVLLDLMKETPRQLLYRELWCASEGFVAFRLKQHRFSGSVAVMSMIGHILGLGDRHLDNILMDLSTGDVVHIDYNVCFDKGLRLKVPEIVPFRLTQTIQAALGLTGIEGVFRADCEAVLEVLKKNKDVILMLLEVFVWDPLVEWTRGDGHDEATIGGEERKGMELAVSLSLFASRFQEIRVPLQEHHDQLLSTVPTLMLTLQDLLEAQEQYENFRIIMLYAEQEKHSGRRTEVTSWSMMNEIITTVEKGEFQMAIVNMRNSTIEAVASISAFWKSVRNHSALTTEAGSMLEEVLVITEGADAASDVWNMAKVASAEHSKLISDLNKVNTLLFSLEAILSSAMNMVKGEFSVSGDQNVGIVADHDQAVLKLLLSKLREVTPILFSIVPGLLSSVKNLHAWLTKLARTASLDAGVLHKALEGVGETQDVSSQDAKLVIAQLPQEQLQPGDHSNEQLKGSHTESPLDEELVFQNEDACWISAPSSSWNSISDTQAQQFEGSWLQSESSQKLVNNWSLYSLPDTKEKGVLEGAMLEYSVRRMHEEKLEGASPFEAQSQGDSTLLKLGKEFSGASRDYISGANTPTFSTKGENSQKQELLQSYSHVITVTSQSIPRVSSFDTLLNTTLGGDQQQSSLSRQQHLIYGKGLMASSSCMAAFPFLSNTSLDHQTWHSHEKNAYAVSVLKRVELKLEGCDVDSKRQLSIFDHVDHLLRQATNIDNLSNMYEGWTPWI